MSIPKWTAAGVLPPILELDPLSPTRSPYGARFAEFQGRFGGTDERDRILEGLRQYRLDLRNAGLVRGFQWVDGSFLEEVERTEGRAPNDVDVVTFYELPAGLDQRQILDASPWLVDHGLVKSRYRVDGYLVSLTTPPERLASLAAYWYSLWSHRRDRLWKGFVRLDLAEDDGDVGVEESSATSRQEQTR